MHKKAELILRIAVAFSLFYAAIASFISPANWIGFLPGFIGGFIAIETALIVFSIVEIVLALLVLFMPNPTYPAVVVAVLFFAVVLFNVGALDIVFRDISLGLTAVALALLARASVTNINTKQNHE